GPNPDMAPVFATASQVVEASLSTGRLSASPIEGRACLAFWDDRAGQLVLHTSTQVPHTVRTGVALSLGLDEHRVRVLSPDVGGGFGQKCVVAREEVLVAAAARLMRQPVKWVEDRRENLVSGFQAREQRYELRAAFDDDGTLLGLEADICCDLGAYSCFPVTYGVEVLMAANELPGPYRLPAYRARSRGVTTNKTPIAPYRGVSRPQAVLALERLMEKAASEIGIGRIELRERNLVTRDQFPYRNIMGASYDEGTYLESLLKCAELLGYANWPETQARAREEGRLVGLGFGCFVEPTAYGTASFGARKMSIVPGYERASVRMDPSGTLVVMLATHSHGQGHATTYAQIAADELGIDPSQVQVRQGDTELVPHGWGTFASRSIVAGGGALSRACASLADQLRRITAHLLEADPADIVIEAGRIGVRGVPSSSIAIEEVARVAHHGAHRLPPELGRGLEASETFDPEGTYSNATHGAIVEVSPETGLVQIVRYAVVEDCGVMINPMIIDGQVSGGVAQGIGSALLEELAFDGEGQPLATSFIDYLLPTATDVPVLELHHLETPTSRTPIGAKGMGEGGAIGAPAAILNAANDALVHLGVEIDRTPIRPADIIAALDRAPDMPATAAAPGAPGATGGRSR
ncbi:MAG TPA: molybdopterin cofactor-binding domain-containing protein, partial [Acidimicrobiales bacterium]|nr:molybdopterin cofactor-binding domain-containing protein [Acidimicrobiales bacterium]